MGIAVVLVAGLLSLVVALVVSAFVLRVAARVFTGSAPDFGQAVGVVVVLAIVNVLVGLGSMLLKVPAPAAAIIGICIQAFILSSMLPAALGKGKRAWFLRCALVALVVQIAGTAVAAPIWLPALDRAREGARATACQNNLKQVGLCLAMFSNEHDGVYPETLSRLYPEYVTDLRIFVCPSTKDEVGDPSRIDSWSSYKYIPGFSEGDTRNAKTVLVCHDRHNNHSGKRYGLYADGHVDLIAAEK
jgi:prepilin-type processing-associated H-X9-DG protein